MMPLSGSMLSAIIIKSMEEGSDVEEAISDEAQPALDGSHR